MGKAIIAIGLFIVAIGLLVQYAPWAINWFGKLPGDIRIEGEKGRLFIPITSMIIVSVVLSIVISWLRR